MDPEWPPRDKSLAGFMNRYRLATATFVGPDKAAAVATLVELEAIVAGPGSEAEKFDRILVILSANVDSYMANHPEVLERAKRIADEAAFGLGVDEPPKES